MNDVARSVVLGAAMISPALLQACKSDGGTPTVRPEPTSALGDGGTMPVATSAPTDTATAAPSASVVRPRTDPTAPPQMPMRGFSGSGARVRA
jgi:hypothetical protein